MRTNKAKAKKLKLSDFSPATIKLAEKMLKEYERQSDEAFLIRAEMERKLSF